MNNNENTDSKKIVYKKAFAVSAVFLLLCSFAVFTYCVYAFDKKQTEQNSALISSSNLQTKSNITSYMNKLEDISKSLFSNSDYVKYDASAAVRDAYQDIIMQEKLTDFFTSQSLLDNYSDFGIIYKNNYSVGIISEGTLKYLGDDPYDKVEKNLKSEVKKWYTENNDKNNKCFYFRRVNKNAVMVASFYITEFKHLFPDFTQMENENIIVTDDSYNIIYSADGRTGKLDDRYINMLSNNDNCTVTDNKSIVSASTDDNGWHYFTTLDLSNQINGYKNAMIICVGIFVCALIVYSVVFALVMSIRKPIRNRNVYQRPESVDKLTGLCNAETVENQIAEKIEKCITGSTILLGLVSISNYGLIKGNYGKEGSDETLIKTAEKLKALYGEKNIVGKTGENEFVIFADFTEYDLFKAYDNLKANLVVLENTLKECELDNGRGMLKYAIGASVYPMSSNDYDELYDCAKTALDISFKKNDGGCVLYSNEETVQTADAGRESR